MGGQRHSEAAYQDDSAVADNSAGDSSAVPCFPFGEGERTAVAAADYCSLVVGILVAGSVACRAAVAGNKNSRASY